MWTPAGMNFRYERHLASTASTDRYQQPLPLSLCSLKEDKHKSRAVFFALLPQCFCFLCRAFLTFRLCWLHWEEQHVTTLHCAPEPCTNRCAGGAGAGRGEGRGAAAEQCRKSRSSAAISCLHEQVRGGKSKGTDGQQGEGRQQGQATGKSENAREAVGGRERAATLHMPCQYISYAFSLAALCLFPSFPLPAHPSSLFFISLPLYSLVFFPLQMKFQLESVICIA